MCLSKSIKRRIILLVLVILLSALLAWVTQEPLRPDSALAQDVLTTPLPNLNHCDDGEGSNFTLAAVGDILLHENIQKLGEQRGYDYLFDNIRPFLQNADYTYANFEGVANPNAPHSAYPTFNYNPAIAVALKNAGVDVVSNANNHALDIGPAGVDATIDSLDKAGLMHHGTTKRNQPKLPYQTLNIVGHDGTNVKAGFISFTFGTNGIPDPYDQVNFAWGANGRLSQELRDSIAKAKAETELVIVAIHWGIEYQFYPSEQQRQGMQDLADAGVDIVLGDHPHTIEPVTWFEKDGHRTLGIYSFGNFVAAQDWNQDAAYTQTALIFYVGFTKLKSGKVQVNGYRYLPVFIENNSRPAPIQPNVYPRAYRHVLTQMRDPEAARVVDPNINHISLKGIEVCRTELFNQTNQAIAGDFYDYFHTLGTGVERKPLDQAVAIVGYPTGEVQQELTGDCQHTTSVLYTERQRLELQPEADWPYRVVGTQLGVEVYKTKYGKNEVERRTDLTGNAIANARFKKFFNAYGGLPVFGYPISPELTETDADSGQAKTVQYFERARFEFVNDAPENVNPLYKVQLGLLGREYVGIEAQCNK